MMIMSSINLTLQELAPIIDWETGGKSYYENHYKSAPIWPQGASGVTIGCGYDLGYNSKSVIQKDWGSHIKSKDLSRLLDTAGKTGESARAAVKSVRDIIVKWDDSIQVFQDVTVPKFIKYTLSTFPGTENLCKSAQIAVLSLVFNRGTSLKNTDRRKEMIALVPLIAKKDYKGMAKQFRSMKRLWDKGCGLIGRREDEAKLIENC